jgi:hypothetical protein
MSPSAGAVADRAGVRVSNSRQLGGQKVRAQQPGRHTTAVVAQNWRESDARVELDAWRASGFRLNECFSRNQRFRLARLVRWDRRLEAVKRRCSAHGITPGAAAGMAGVRRYRQRNRINLVLRAGCEVRVPGCCGGSLAGARRIAGAGGMVTLPSSVRTFVTVEPADLARLRRPGCGGAECNPGRPAER